jgi:hypothetical protein
VNEQIADEWLEIDDTLSEAESGAIVARLGELCGVDALRFAALNGIHLHFLDRSSK